MYIITRLHFYHLSSSLQNTQRAEEIGRQKRKFKATDEELQVAILQLYGLSEKALLYERRRRAEDALALVNEFKKRGAATDDRKQREQLAKLCRMMGRNGSNWRSYVGGWEATGTIGEVV